MKFILPLLFCCLLESEAQIPVFDSFTSFETIYLAQKNDTTYVYNFWATWCKPCVEELPFFTTLSHKYKKDKVRFVFVSLDAKRDHEKLKKFAEKHLPGESIIHLSDHRYHDWIDLVSPEWAGSIPGTLLLSKNKKAFHEKQFEDLNDLQNTLLHFIKL